MAEFRLAMTGADLPGHLLWRHPSAFRGTWVEWAIGTNRPIITRLTVKRRVLGSCQLHTMVYNSATHVVRTRLE
jgi:hypothetical protein